MMTEDEALALLERYGDAYQSYHEYACAGTKRELDEAEAAVVAAMIRNA